MAVIILGTIITTTSPQPTPKTIQLLVNSTMQNIKTLLEEFP